MVELVDTEDSKSFALRLLVQVRLKVNYNKMITNSLKLSNSSLLCRLQECYFQVL